MSKKRTRQREVITHILPSTRSEAKQLKSKYYFTGIPCKRGHISYRYTSTTDCIDCWLQRYYDNHEASLKQKREYYQNTKEARRKYDKEHHEANKDKINSRKRERIQERLVDEPLLLLEQHLRQAFKLSLQEYDELLLNQDYKCLICEQPFHRSHVNKDRDTCVDHDKNTGKIRGILCRLCNIGLGHFKDNVQFLQSAILYLTLNKGIEK